MIFDINVILIGLIFCLGFFIESVLGFGGTLVAFAILGFFIDIKELVIATIYIGSCASIYVIASNPQAFVKTVFKEYFPLCIIGNIIGVFLFVILKSAILLKVFAIFLIIITLRSLFFDHIKLKSKISKLIAFIGGISHGTFGIGGPIFVIALREKFANKSFMRVTLAMFFLSLNFARALQLKIEGKMDLESFLKFWWVAIPLIPAIHIGYKLHKLINEKFFRLAVLIFILFSGIKFLLS